MTTAFLVLALLFPRITLAVCWLFGWMPSNDTPIAADVLAWVFAPRLLCAWWTHHADGVHAIWTALFVVCFVLSLFGGGSASSRRREVTP